MARPTRQNNITSPELLDKVNQDNIRLKEDFLDYLRSVQRSPKTIHGYENDLDIFWVWNYEHNKDKFFTKVTKRDIASFQGWLINENGNSPARVRRIKATLSSLSNYIENMCDDDPEFEGFHSVIKKVENPAMQTVRQKTVWDDESLEELLNTLMIKKQFKKACMLALAMCSGRRKAELCRFKVDDFKQSNLVCENALYKTSEPMKTKGFGLGKYIYCYTLAKKFRPYFDTWMEQRKIEGIKSEWLFPSPKNPDVQISEDAMNAWARDFTKLTGRNFYWHSLRHYFTTHLAKLGLPDSIIQEIVGWESADMVKIYKDISAEEQIASYFDSSGNIRARDKNPFSKLT